MTFSRLPVFALLLGTLLFAIDPAYAATTDWPQFRGPSGNGVAVGGANLPDTWSTSENIEWSAAVPGLGWASPVVADGRVFISTVVTANASDPQSGLPTDSDGREVLAGGRVAQGEHEWRVYCFGITTGKPCPGWTNGYTSLHTAIPEFSRHPKSTYANETPVVDDNNVYVRVGDLGLWAVSVEDGSEQWEVLTGHPGDGRQSWGSASSPVLAGGNVIIGYDTADGTWLAAFATTDGTRRWRVNRIQTGDVAQGFDARQEPSTWATPYVWNNGIRTEIVVSDPDVIASYDPTNGNRIWWLRGACTAASGTVQCKKTWAAIPTPFSAGGLLYVSAGYRVGPPQPLYAIRPGASGDISLASGETSNEYVAWFRSDAGNYLTSPLVHGGIFYSVKTRGFIEAYEADTGTRIYRERLGSGTSFTASPWTDGDRIFAVSEDGDTYVIDPGRTLRVVRVNSLDEMTMASPAVAGNRLFIRTRSSLYSVVASGARGGPPPGGGGPPPGGGGPPPGGGGPPPDGGGPPPPDPDPNPDPVPEPPPLPTMSLADAQASESAGAVVFDVRLSRTSGSVVTVDYETAEGAAKAGADYTAMAGTLTFAPGTQAGRIRVPVTDDRRYEAAPETFMLTLRRPVNATLAGGGRSLRVTGTILDDDDGPPTAAFQLTGAACGEKLCRASTGVPVELIDMSTDMVLSRHWDFGDGTTSSSLRPAHSWSEPGFYEVTLEVSDGETTSSASRKFLVEAAYPAGTCVADDETRCLGDSRFAVEMDWWTADGASGPGRVVHEGTNDSALFYFFDPGDNWELLIKVLDGGAVNGHFWVYGASATTLGYTIRVTDTVTGTVREYRNEDGRRADAITDSEAFAGASGARSSAASSAPQPGVAPTAGGTAHPRLTGVEAASESGGCTESATTLCLLDGRYAVSVAWSTAAAGGEPGETGQGMALRPRTPDSGLFHFFGPNNWEMLVKVLDACQGYGHHWVFAASATDLGLDLRVRDTVTGAVRQYVKDPGKPSPAVVDVTAFPDACRSD